MITIKNLANIITSSRIAFAIAMLFVTPFSVPFWIFYLCAGISDAIDGYVARKWNQQSDFGARLDSIADLFFAVIVAIIILINIKIPFWLWTCGAGIAFLRFMSYSIGYCKFHQFSSLHTYANKATGGSVFILPVLIFIFGLDISGLILCIIAFLSSIEELIITIKSKELNRDCKGIFSCMKKTTNQQLSYDIK